MLRYCAWCDSFLGVKAGKGHQVREDRSEVDTAAICPPCFAKLAEEISLPVEMEGDSRI
ncbi:hypothetical protein [Geoalkalibacter ferrihydriticus]|uniref:hypothetical protein n=1 Tax=Geoalkalibacter ferrihydriticus TaxID=392333 RepID=UPI0012947FCA|nr:hypothetical protein [Geoalkalibacter ferrihydriticus]